VAVQYIYQIFPLSFIYFFCFSSNYREQRLTGILVFVLTGVSIFLAPILQVSLLKWQR